MMRQIVVGSLAALIWVCFGSSSSPAGEVLPLRSEPVERARLLAQPARSVHLALAEAMHQAQEKQLAAAQEDGIWRCHFIMGLAFALEEYYQMELSFPENVTQLEESGYLLDAWGESGMSAVDFTRESAEFNEWTLIYVPQPVGLVSLIRGPGRAGCVRMRCYTEYSLLVPDKHLSLWKGGGQLPRTWWLKPFLEFAVREITHLNHTDPGGSRCACALR